MGVAEEEKWTALEQGPASSILRDRDGMRSVDGGYSHQSNILLLLLVEKKSVCVGTFLFLTKSSNIRQ